MGDRGLPTRIANYEPSWLDAQCLSGQRTWARLLPPRGRNGRPQPGSPVRATPITLLERRRAQLWLSRGSLDGMQPSAQAQTVLDRLAAMARCSSMSSSTVRACCAPRLRMRWQSSWPLVS